MSGAAETLRAALADLERREGQLDERICDVDAQCQEKVSAAEALVADKLKEVEEQHARYMHVQEEARARLETLRGHVEHGRSGRVKLNVGGSIFETTIATLTKFPHTFFHAAFVSFRSGDSAPQDADGCFFIDRDGTHFDAILEFLRKGKVRLPVDAGDINDLMEEVRYYMLEEPFVDAIAGEGTIEVTTDTSASRGNAKSAGPDFTRKEVLQMVASRQKNFSGYNLSGLDLAGVHFVEESNFANATLQRTKMHRASLTGACFFRADLSHADLSHAGLQGAKLARANMADANLRGAYLVQAEMADANLEGANLEGAVRNMFTDLRR